MGSKIRSISITDLQDKWLNEQKDLNFSKKCQDLIDDLIKQTNKDLIIKKNEEENQAMHERITSLRKQLQLRCDFIEEKKFFDDFLIWEGIKRNG